MTAELWWRRIERRRVKPRLTEAQRAALDAALAKSGLSFDFKHQVWRGRSDCSGSHQTTPVDALARFGWLVLKNKSMTGRRRDQCVARLSDHANDLLARSLLLAGLFVTRDELRAVTDQQRAELAVWADATIEGARAPIFWIEVLRRSHVDVRPTVARTIRHERWVFRHLVDRLAEDGVSSAQAWETAARYSGREAEIVMSA